MYRVLIVGCGTIAGGYDHDRPSDALPLTHAGAFTRDGRFVLAACVDPDPEACRSFAQRWSVRAQAGSIGALDAAPGQFDIISICSPTSLHADHLDQALSLRPRLIFCEKPIAQSAVEAQRLIEACERQGVELVVNYTRRWAPDAVAMAQALAAGEWGAVRSAVGTYTKGVVHNGGHMVDLLRLLLGELKLVAAGQAVFDHWDDDPTVAALLETDRGVPVTLMPGDARDFAVFELTIVTEQGVIAMLDGGRRWSLRRTEPSVTFAGYTVLGDGETVGGRYDEAMLAAVANIAEALDHDSPLASTGANALAAHRLCDAIRSTATSAEFSREG